MEQMTESRQYQDYLCVACGFHNFGRNEACLKCSQPRHAQRQFVNGSKAGRADDWTCSCGDLVFGTRFSCRKCGQPRPSRNGGNGGGGGYFQQQPQQPQYAPRGGNYYQQQPNYYAQPTHLHQQQQHVHQQQPQGQGVRQYGAPPQLRPGDWVCTCGEHVYAVRDSCRNCGAQKPVSPTLGAPRAQREFVKREGDWDCECGFQNFASRSECKKCNKQRPNSS